MSDIMWSGLSLTLRGGLRSLVGFEPNEFHLDVLAGICLGIGVAAMLFLAFPALAPRAEIVGAGVMLSGLVPVVLRLVVRNTLTQDRVDEGMLVVGSGERARQLYRALAGISRTVLEGALTEPQSLRARGSADEVAANTARLAEVVAVNRITRVIVAEEDADSRAKLAASLVEARLRGLKVSEASEFFESQFRKVWLDALSPEWFVYSGGFSQSKATTLLKRAIDVSCTLLLLLPLTMPLLVVIAIAIKLDSQGPVFFRQVRVGLFGKNFVMYKLRTMRKDAEVEESPTWAAKHDGRVTRVGTLLRRFRLDELPQMINVLKGDMSLVGPRPERPFFVEKLQHAIPYYKFRHYVKPGITGWAQVSYPYGASVEAASEKLQYDLYYAKRWSVRYDAEILLKTVKVVLSGRGR